MGEGGGCGAKPVCESVMPLKVRWLVTHGVPPSSGGGEWELGFCQCLLMFEALKGPEEGMPFCPTAKRKRWMCLRLRVPGNKNPAGWEAMRGACQEGEPPNSLGNGRRKKAGYWDDDDTNFASFYADNIAHHAQPLQWWSMSPSVLLQ